VAPVIGVACFALTPGSTTKLPALFGPSLFDDTFNEGLLVAFAKRGRSRSLHQLFPISHSLAVFVGLFDHLSHVTQGVSGYVNRLSGLDQRGLQPKLFEAFVGQFTVTCYMYEFIIKKICWQGYEAQNPGLFWPLWPLNLNLISVVNPMVQKRLLSKFGNNCSISSREKNIFRNEFFGYMFTAYQPLCVGRAVDVAIALPWMPLLNIFRALFWTN